MMNRKRVINEAVELDSELLYDFEVGMYLMFLERCYGSVGDIEVYSEDENV